MSNVCRLHSTRQARRGPPSDGRPALQQSLRSDTHVNEVFLARWSLGRGIHEALWTRFHPRGRRALVQLARVACDTFPSKVLFQRADEAVVVLQSWSIIVDVTQLASLSWSGWEGNTRPGTGSHIPLCTLHAPTVVRKDPVPGPPGILVCCFLLAFAPVGALCARQLLSAAMPL